VSRTGISVETVDDVVWKARRDRPANMHSVQRPLSARAPVASRASAD
jgi:hypothetical protein